MSNLTIREKVELTLLEFPSSRFYRPEFFINYLVMFHQAEYTDTHYKVPAVQLRAFFTDFATIERTLREFLKSDERFELPKKANLLRKRKQMEFQVQYRK